MSDESGNASFGETDGSEFDTDVELEYENPNGLDVSCAALGDVVAVRASLYLIPTRDRERGATVVRAYPRICDRLPSERGGPPQPFCGRNESPLESEWAEVAFDGGSVCLVGTASDSCGRDVAVVARRYEAACAAFTLREFADAVADFALATNAVAADEHAAFADLRAVADVGARIAEGADRGLAIGDAAFAVATAHRSEGWYEVEINKWKAPTNEHASRPRARSAAAAAAAGRSGSPPPRR